MSDRISSRRPLEDGLKFIQSLQDLGTLLSHEGTEADKAEDEKARHDAWIGVANVFHEWDTKEQDVLAATSATEAATYQLGRGLAKAYWSLDPLIAEEGDARSWMSLLGSARCLALQRFMVQLTPTLGDFTSSTVNISLDAWRGIAMSATRRTHPDAVERLDQQIQNWHILLVEGVDARSLITVHRFLSIRGSTWTVVRAFALPAMLATLGFAAAIGAVVALTAFKSNALISALVAILGFFGITAAGAVARAKDAADASLARMREAANRAIVAGAVTTVPTEERHWGLRWPIVRVP